MQQIVAAFDAARARDLALVGGDERHALLHERDSVRRLHIAHEEVKAGLAAHRAAVDDAVREARVARVGREQVLKGVTRRRLDIGAGVRVDHADVVGRDVAVDARGIHARLQVVMVYFKARNSFHAFFSFLLPELRFSTYLTKYMIAIITKAIITETADPKFHSPTVIN